MMVFEPDLSKTYEFFLADLTEITVAGKEGKNGRTTGSAIQLRWREVGNQIDVVERLANTSPVPAARISELVSRIYGKPPVDSNDAKAALKLGMHIWTKLQMHWVGGKSDIRTFEFVYDSITGRQPGEKKVDQKIRDRIRKYLVGIQTRTAAIDKIKSVNPEYLAELENMIEDGSIKLE